MESGAKRLKRGKFRVIVGMVVNTLLCSLGFAFALGSYRQDLTFAVFMWVVVVVFTARNVYKGAQTLKKLWVMDKILKTQGEEALKQAIKDYLENENKKRKWFF